MARLDPHSHFDPEQPLMKELRWRMDVDFDAHTLRGEAILILAGAGTGTMDLDTDGLLLHSITTQDGTPVAWELGDADPVLGRRLRLDLPGGTTSLTIAYESSPGAVALQWLVPEQTAGGRHPFLFSQCQPHHARSMVPLQDSPRVRFPYHAELTVPKALRAVMSAGETGRKDGPRPDTTTYSFHMPQPIPAYLLALAVGDIDARDVGPRSRVYAEPETVEAAAWEFGEMESMIVKAESLFGPYEWDRYDVLVLPPSFPYGGMENPRLTFLTPTLLAGDRSLVAVVAHELAHSWTGNLVTNATMNDFWLNEGFTVWAERRILEALKGKEYVAMAWAIGQRSLGDAFERFGADHPYTKLKTDLWGVDPDSMYSEVPYEKGARLVALFEKTMGREAFDAFIADYIARFRFTSITTEEFLAFLRERVPGLSEKVGAMDWIYQPGLPANSPVFTSARLESLESLAAGWTSGRRPSSEEAGTWTPDEVLVYLQRLPRPLGPEDCAWLDRTFSLTGQGNYEILVEWLTIAASSDYEPVFDRVRKVLTTVGRMKYVRPLYKALGGHPRTRALAKETFARASHAYHALTRRVAETVIEDYPAE